MHRLAIEGGQPVVPAEFQRFTHPVIDHEIEEELVQQSHEAISIYDSGGVFATLESELGRAFESPLVLSTNSGTSALLSLYYGAGICPGDEVVVPSYTFFATIMPLLALGASLRFADCYEAGNVDPSSVRRTVTNRTKAIVVVHLWGIPCDMEELSKIASETGCLLLEDASHAHGATYAGHSMGYQSDGAAWSLQGKKILTTGEGGFLATKHRQIFERAVLLGHFNKRAKQQVLSDELRAYAVTGAGMNLRMHPIAARLGVVMLRRLPAMIRERRESAAIICRAVESIDGLRIPKIPEDANPSWYGIPILYDGSRFANRSVDDFVAAMNAEGAVEVDVPGATCSVEPYAALHSPEELWANYKHKAQIHVGSGEFSVARYLNSRVFKMPSWYGPRGGRYADAYAEALTKVAALSRAPKT
jgi:dTDP-4-amino-4,6-dideoxygalactose transaminase